MAVDIDDNEQNEKLRDIWINYKNFILIGLGSVSYTHLTLPTKSNV